MKTLTTQSLPHPLAARQAVNLTQTQLAERARVGYQTVHRAEKMGRYPGTIDVRERYLKALGISERRP